MGRWHDKNDNSMNVGDSRSVVAARPHLCEVVQQRRGSRSVAGGDGVWGRLGCTGSGCAWRRGTARPTAALAKLLAARLLQAQRQVRRRLGSGRCGEQADTGIAATAGATRQLCAPVVQQQQERQGARSACVVRSEGVAVDTAVRLRQRNRLADAPLQGLLQDVKVPMTVVAS